MSYSPPFPGRAELLTQAMLDLARERGVHDMSIRSLAAAVRAAPGSLTYHHRDKDTILATCARFLGFWLSRDMEDRLATGGWAALLPEPRAEQDHDELEYVVRLRVWIQLSAYALSSPTVAAPVCAGEERMLGVFTGRAGGTGPDTAELARWAVFKSLATMVLQPSGSLGRDQALAAAEWTASYHDLLGRPSKENEVSREDLGR